MRQSRPHGIRFICADATSLASVINIVNFNARLKFSKYTIINVLNAFLDVSEILKKKILKFKF